MELSLVITLNESAYLYYYYCYYYYYYYYYLCSSEMSVDFEQTSQHYILEDETLLTF
jgi:hypothetical protein